MNNSFISQFSKNIKFNYTCFDRVIIRGYILKFFSLACVVLFFRALGFSRKSTGIMRIFTDQLNSHISNQAAREIDGSMLQQRINYWMNLFFKFDKGKYATRSKHMNHDWYLSQVEVCSNVIFKSARFCTSLFGRLLDKFSRVGLPNTINKKTNHSIGLHQPVGNGSGHQLPQSTISETL